MKKALCVVSNFDILAQRRGFRPDGKGAVRMAHLQATTRISHYDTP